MQKFLQKIFQLQPGEGLLFVIFGFLIFGNALARQVSSIVSVSGVLDVEGPNALLIVLIIDYLLILLVGALQSIFIDRFNRVHLIAFVSFAFALVFVLLRILFWMQAPEWLNYSTMYLVAEQQFVLFPLVFWVLANDVFSFSQAKRLFPLVGSLSFIGTLVGIAISGITPTLFKMLNLVGEDILLFNAVVYIAAALMILINLKKMNLRDFTKQTESLKETLSGGFEFVRDVLSFRYLMIAILFLAIADTIIEFRFWVVTASAFSGQVAYQNFFSLYRLSVTVIAFAIQSLFTSRLINNIHLKNVLLIFPFIAFVASGSMLLLPSLAAVIVSGMFIVKLTRDTVDDSSRKSFQALVPEERRGRVSTFMDSYLTSIGTILGASLTGIIVLIGQWLGRDLSLVYLTLAVIASIVAIWATFAMRSVYEKSLLNWRLKRRQRMTSSIINKLEDF